MRTETQRLLDDLRTIQWFGCSGVFESTEPGIFKVVGASEAKKSCSTLEWENFKNAVGNRFLELLWNVKELTEEKQNDISRELTESVYRFFELNSDRVFGRIGATPGLTRSVRADVMGAVFEVEFSHLVSPLFFYPLLLPWYKKGHLPCGWHGDEIDEFWKGNGIQDLPSGQLMVH